MFITKRHLSRRTVLKGMSASVALPFLDSMVPAQTALKNSAATPKTRFAAIYVPHGATPIDASGQLVDGTKLNGPDSLRQALLARSDVFAEVAAEKLLTYAIGRAMRPQDMASVRAVTRGAAKEKYRFSSLVLGVVKTPQFQMRTKSVK